MKLRFFFSIILFLALTFYVTAQTESRVPTDTVIANIARQYADSIDELDCSFENWHYTGSDTLSNPYYFQLFSGPTFFGHAVHNRIGRLSPASALKGNWFHNATQKALNYQRRTETTADALTYIYTQQPWLISKLDTDAPEDVPFEVAQEVKPQVKLAEQIEKTDETETLLEDPTLDIEIRKPNFWTIKSDFSFQLIQNYITDNWYKGGESNHSMMAEIIAQANFDNKQKLTFNNKLEMKLGFQSSSSDEKHKYKTNTDLLRLTNEVGLKASKHWFYSTMLQSWTQFYRGYKKNDERIYSDFLSPFESLLTVGMKYSFESKNKKFKIDINLSPLAGHVKYVGRPSLETAFGLPEEHHSKLEYGSNITATYKWDICQNISWNGRFFYYTNYDKTQVEWENTFNLKVNKFLSTKLFVYPRFDDGVARSEPDASYFQFNEYLSISLNLSI